MLEELFHPRSVVVLGASRSPGKAGHELVVNLKDGGFRGRIIPVNPAAGSVAGLPCLVKLADYHDPLDLGIITLPRAGVLEAAGEAVKAGVKVLVVVTAGFREADAEGAALEQQLVDLCRRNGVRLLGPNCLGLINPAAGLNASCAAPMPAAGNVSVISQSGALAAAFLDLASDRHLGLAKMVSIGNKADLTEVDLLRVLGRDESTSVIVGYLEDIVSGDDFVKVAEEASSRKPVIILKSGITGAGLKAAGSHTGVLAGSDIAYGAAFKRSGVIRADTFESLLDYAAAFATQPLPGGNRVLIVTNAGGPGIMAADAVEKAGLRVVGAIPGAAGEDSPVDVLGDAGPERYVAAVNAGQENPDVDAIIVLFAPHVMTDPERVATAVAGGLRGKKPVFFSSLGGRAAMPGRDGLIARGLPFYEAPERAAGALKAMCEYAAWRNRPPRMVTRFRVNRRRVERIISRRLRSGRPQLGEVKAKSILLAYGFQVPAGHLAVSREEAVEFANQVGFPVAMKIVSPDLVHKAGLGGVRLNINSGEAVRDAFDLMLMRLGERAPDAWIEGVYVEQMLTPGLEVIIGMSRDLQFGPMLMFGLGGIFVEVMKDVTFHLAPITETEAIQMLQSTRSYEILRGKREGREIDLAAIANGLQRISQLTTDFPQIAELDINPFIVGGAGSDSWVADARMTLHLDPGEGGP